MMHAPIAEFVQGYAGSGISRFHMPGHKGRGPLGCEGLDITEVSGADSLYEAEGIIAESEANAAALFGSARTLYSTEGSSQCIRAMLCLALTQRTAHMSRTVLAARNVHKTFVYAAGMLDLEVQWLYPEESTSICSCPISAEALEAALNTMEKPPLAVYLTSPDYLGGMAEISALAAVCEAHGTILAVDNAHGAYLRFLSPSMHPLDLGAHLCCDSAHKTLPVLTGGAYLHIGKNAPAGFARQARSAMAMFGSTSPSYLTLASLDLCNVRLADELPRAISAAAEAMDAFKAAMRQNGWEVCESDPLRLTIAAPEGLSGKALAQRLRTCGVECEYADATHLVLMATPDNREEEFLRLAAALGKNDAPRTHTAPTEFPVGERVMSIREALFAPHICVPIGEAAGKICACPSVSCPPAIPIVVSGERISPEAVELFRRCGIEYVDVVQ